MLLDLGLFLRENHVLKIDKKTNEKSILHISSAIRGFLFTIACRIGSDPYSWVSQETLTEELDITLDGVKKLSKKALETNLIESIPNPSDKRKRMYRPAKFLINYTQKRREKLSTEDGLGTFFLPKKVDKRTPKISRKVDKSLPSRCPNVHRISENEQDKITNNQQLKELYTEPKGHTTTIINKQPVGSRKERGLISDKFYPNYENQKLADQIGSKVGKTGSYLIKRFIDVMTMHKVKDNDFDRRFKEFLLKELPARKMDGFKEGVKQISSYI